LDNVQRVLAIELLCAAQALDFRSPVKTSPMLARLVEAFRKEVSFNDADRVLHNDMIKAEQFLNQDPDSIIR
jgi:histidine ammonia-lyase